MGFASAAREFLLDIRVAQNLLVLRTPPATANVLASALDQEDWPDVTGTIAGDDTVLVIAPDAKTAEVLRGQADGVSPEGSMVGRTGPWSAAGPWPAGAGRGRPARTGGRPTTVVRGIEQMPNVYICRKGVRTPIGRYGGALAMKGPHRRSCGASLDRAATGLP